MPTENVFDQFTVDPDDYAARVAAAKAGWDALPAEIQDLATKLQRVERQYSGTAGWYDRSQGDNIRIGMFTARLFRAIDAAGLNGAMTLYRIADYWTYFRPKEG